MACRHSLQAAAVSHSRTPARTVMTRVSAARTDSACIVAGAVTAVAVAAASVLIDPITAAVTSKARRRSRRKMKAAATSRGSRSSATSAAPENSDRIQNFRFVLRAG